jgi:hypothetical protein
MSDKTLIREQAWKAISDIRYQKLGIDGTHELCCKLSDAFDAQQAQIEDIQQKRIEMKRRLEEMGRQVDAYRSGDKALRADNMALREDKNTQKAINVRLDTLRQGLRANNKVLRKALDDAITLLDKAPVPSDVKLQEWHKIKNGLKAVLKRAVLDRVGARTTKQGSKSDE